MPETLADIVAEMRELAADIESGNAVVGQTVWRNYADRIDAAAKRERVEVEADALSAGGLVEAMRHKPSNAAAMREALVFADRVLRATTEDGRYGDDVVYLVGCMLTVARACRSALAKPRRNCDVGTAEEQAKRLYEWCSGRHCVNCQFKGGWPDECKLRWAQMPYEEGGK